MPCRRNNILSEEGRKEFYGKPFRVLRKVNCFTRKGFVLFLVAPKESAGVVKIGENLNLHLLVLENIGYCDHVIQEISDYYGKIKITIRLREKNEGKKFRI